MRRSILAATAALALLVGVSSVPFALGQDGQGQRRGQGDQDRQDRQQRRGQGQGQFDPEQARARMAEALKERLGASDEDWQAIQPRIERVMEAQQQARAGGMMGMVMGGGRGQGGPGGRGPGADAEPTPVMAAARELRTTLEDEAVAAEQIREKLDAYRAARKQAEDELAAAREDLRGLLTQRQEAILVLAGMLE